MLESYVKFLEEFDKRLLDYFKKHSGFLYCKKGCSLCCEKGDYPLSQIELEYLMRGFVLLDNGKKQIVQANYKNMEKGGVCPFLVDKECSLYEYRPLICRVHGLAYVCRENTVKLPYCAKEGKNYSNVLNKDGTVEINPVADNLDTQNILREFNAEETYPIKNLYDWLK